MILLIFITKSDKLNNYVNSGKIIHPEGYVKKRMETATSASSLCRSEKEVMNALDKQINPFISNINGFIVFCDNSYHDEIKSKLGNSALVSKLGDYSDYLDESVKTKQYLEDNITLALKVFFWMREAFNNGLGELLRLPIRNFNDADFRKICIRVSSILSNDNINKEMDEVYQTLSMLKTKTRKPKKRPHTSKKFYVDEKNFFFEYGKEDHSRHETDFDKGHNTNCNISARFRFGVKIDETKHFNVCKNDKENSCIEGIFESCHGHDVTIKRTTHINMFSNDYIA